MVEFRDRIRHPQLQLLYDYWRERRAGRRFPSRADIDPVDLKFALGNVTLIDVLRDPLRFRFRLAGSLFAQRIGMDLTGKLVDEIPDPEYRAQVLQVYTRMAETGEPTIALSERLFDGEPRKFETLRLPLSDDGEMVTMLLICPMYFERPPGRSPLGGSGRGFSAPKTIEES